MSESTELWEAGEDQEPAGPGWVLHRAPLDADVAAEQVTGWARLCVVTGRGGARLGLGEGAHAQHVPALEALLVPSGVGVEGLWESRTAVCCLAFRPEALDGTVEALRLGERRYRCALAPGVAALVLVAAGSARLRVSGEELPIELAAWDGCHAPGTPRGRELDVTGLERGAALLIFELAPHA